MPVEPEATSAKLKRVIGYRVAVKIIIRALIQLAETGRIDEQALSDLKQCGKHV